MMPNLFEHDRSYVLGDPELEIIGDREKLADPAPVGWTPMLRLSSQERSVRWR